jgi:formylglycine-generating enzyme required for sulfatase activity
MGSNERDEEQPVHEVNIDYEFEIGKCTVTVEEYMTFVEDTNSHHPEWLEEGNKYNIKTGTEEHYKNINQKANAPIVGVSWHDAMAYCEWLSEKTNNNYRLPTEAEWEYACRAGTTTKWSFGDNEKELGKYAVYRSNSNSQAEVVGTKLRNPWGLYDMHGNVWEWCLDDYVDNYKDTPRDGTAYINESSKVLRGGSWNGIVDLTQSAVRGRLNPTNRGISMGFRLLRTLP